MSTNTNNTPIFASNTNENNLTSKEQSYDDLVGYCALRKQFSRIIPSYYINIQKQCFKDKGSNISSIEEYKKLKEEINIMKDSIEALKESKQKKLKQIEELRIIMRKVGRKQITYKEKKQVNNNINNYCAREKQVINQDFRCNERKGSNNFKVPSDEGLSLASTISGLSGLSSGKDEDVPAEDGGNQGAPSYNISNRSSGSWCFTEDIIPKERMLRNPEREPDTTTLISN